MWTRNLLPVDRIFCANPNLRTPYLMFCIKPKNYIIISFLYRSYIIPISFFRFLYHFYIAENFHNCRHYIITTSFFRFTSLLYQKGRMLYQSYITETFWKIFYSKTVKLQKDIKKTDFPNWESLSF